MLSNTRSRPICRREALLKASEIVGQPETIVGERTTGVNEGDSHHLAREPRETHALPGLIGEREIRHRRPDGKRRRRRIRFVESGQHFQPANQQRFLRQVFVLVNANVLGLGTIFFHDQREIHKHAGFQALRAPSARVPGSASPWLSCNRGFPNRMR